MNSSCMSQTELTALRTASFWLQILLLASLGFVVMFGNGLVMIALSRRRLRRKLRSTTRVLIGSLSVADFSVGLLVLPLSTANELFKRWVLGPALCPVWLASDVWFCTTSIYHLLSISLDRYVAIKYPLRYPSLMTHRSGIAFAALAWLLAFVLCSPMVIFHWSAFLDANWMEKNSCVCSPMNSPPLYIFISSFLSFFLPMLVNGMLNCKILFIARRIRLQTEINAPELSKQARLRFEAAQRTSMQITSDAVSSEARPISRSGSTSIGSSTSHAFPETMRVHRGSVRTYRTFGPLSDNASGGLGQSFKKRSSDSNRNCVSKSQNLLPSPAIPSHIHLRYVKSRSLETPGHALQQLHRQNALDRTQSLLKDGSIRNSDPCITNSSRAAPAPASPIPDLRRLSRDVTARISEEIKAFRPMVVVTGCFTMCWSGFAICYTLQGFWSLAGKDFYISPGLFSVFFWLGYINSACNPVIYALCNQDFRREFQLILSRKRGLNRVVHLKLRCRRSKVSTYSL